jgi:hypothetical protein
MYVLSPPWAALQLSNPASGHTEQRRPPQPPHTILVLCPLPLCQRLTANAFQIPRLATSNTVRDSVYAEGEMHAGAEVESLSRRSNC